jgi:probable phosphoglycerate mutase
MSADGVTRLVLVRHGESLATVQRVIGGPRTCRGLSDLGHRQSNQLAVRLAETAELRIDHLYSSAFARARETAAHLEGAVGRRTTVEAVVGEHDPGPQCDGLSYDEFIERYGMPDWESDPHAVVFAGGETVAEFQARITGGIDMLVERHVGESILIVCHGGVIDAVMRRMLQAPVVGGFQMYTSNTSLTEFHRLETGQWRLVRYNDAAHLAGEYRVPVRLEGSP